MWVRDREHDKTKAKRQRQLKHNCRAKVLERDGDQAGKVDHLKYVGRREATDLERGESWARKKMKMIHSLIGDASLASAVRRLTCGCGLFAGTTGHAGAVAVLIRRSSWLALCDHF